MKFKIENEIFEKYPELKIGIIVVKDIDNTGQDDEILKKVQDEIEKIRQNHSKPTLSENAKIAAWRKEYSSFGAKPKKYKCSVENLYRMILDDIDLKHYSKLVDIYNYISLKYMIPVGGDDIDHVDGNITLKFAEGNEKFIQLNSLEESNPKEGEVVYCDDNEVLCRRWNWRECDKSKMTENTKNATLVVEALEPVSIDELNTILDEMSDNINQYCGGESKQFILTKENIEIELGDN